VIAVMMRIRALWLLEGGSVALVRVTAIGFAVADCAPLRLKIPSVIASSRGGVYCLTRRRRVLLLQRRGQKRRRIGFGTGQFRSRHRRDLFRDLFEHCAVAFVRIAMGRSGRECIFDIRFWSGRHIVTFFVVRMSRRLNTDAADFRRGRVACHFALSGLLPSFVVGSVLHCALLFVFLLFGSDRTAHCAGAFMIKGFNRVVLDLSS